MLEIFESSDMNEIKSIVDSLNVPSGHVVQIAVVPKKKYSPKVDDLIKKSKAVLEQKKRNGYTPKQAGKDFVEARNGIVEKYCRSNDK